MGSRRRKRSVTEMLGSRSSGLSDAGALLRLNLKILRAVILQDHRTFTRVWSKTSKSTISYEDGRIYFENFRSCYSSIHSEPQIQYMLPKCSKLEKIENALLCQSPLDKALPNPSDHKPCLLALTADNWLYRLAAQTGDVLQKIYLSPHFKFRYIGWDVPQETFYLKSTQNKGTPLAGQSGLNQGTLMHLAIFHVFPLEIVGILEITKEVFGNSVTDAVLAQGVLCVSHSNKSVKLYSCEHILKKATNGIQEMNRCSLEDDWIFFHHDDSGRIIHFGPSTINVLKILKGLKSGMPCEVVVDFSIAAHRDVSVDSQVVVTSSGRTVKRRAQQLDDDPDQETFRLVEYEDELDLLAVVVTDSEEGEAKAHVRLFDNKSGDLLKTVPLAGCWDETYCHGVFIDRETIIHIGQKNNNYSCNVYKLQNSRK
ncbi:DDB1- and CUL4-associated factor 17 isoform X2 [Lampris incognitus]|uniref:DDB1- and CUL4-associated factor 17 isoform X2 n=1 Tax=Lampris incognitus TaxID=2546036 RepID=UPI0024B5F059|nr:DDB1- and CUL4-associated factor 17 isoform X2 [Lampris incognitus]